MKLRTKLLAGYIGVSLLAAIISAVGILSLNSIKVADKQAFDTGTMGVVGTQNIIVAYDILKVAVREEALSVDEAGNKAAFDMYQKGLAAMDKALKDYSSTFTNTVDEANFKKLQDSYAAYLPYAQKSMELGLANKNAEAGAIFRDPITIQVRNKLSEAVQNITDFNIAHVRMSNEANVKTTNNSIILMLLITCAAIILALSIGLILAGSVMKTVGGEPGDIEKIAEQVSTGNLNIDTSRANKTTGIHGALLVMVGKLKTIVTDINSASSEVASGSQQLSSTAQEMSQGATEQAASVEEISSSMEQMSSNIKHNAENAQMTEKIAHKTSMSAEEGGKAVTQTVEAMKVIASKTNIIEEIARSTNMLALNASIEAARAGEYGKGFAVVASEVGKLAERSQKEAGEISKLSSESVKIAEHAGQTINAIIPDIKRTAELVQEISASSNEQDTGANQINQAILQLDQVIQQNASASEESASMAEELAGQSGQMQDIISFFRLANAGEMAARQMPHAETHATARNPAPQKIESRNPESQSPEPKRLEAKKAEPQPKAPRKTEIPKREPLTGKTGIHIALDDDVPRTPGTGGSDTDFQEF
jgi:methyl-accepting chemotaxis protein